MAKQKLEYIPWLPKAKPSDLFPYAYELKWIKSIEELEKVLLFETDYMGFDTETTGLNQEEIDLVGYSFCLDGKTAYYVPVWHYNFELGERAVELIYEKMCNTKIVAMFNMRYDVRVMEYRGYTTLFKEIENLDISDEEKEIKKLELSRKPYIKYDMTKVNVFDVQAVVFLVDTNIKYPSLKNSEEWYLGWRGASFEQTIMNAENENAITMKKNTKTGEMEIKNMNFYYLSPEEAYEYACVTGDTLIQTKEGYKPIVDIKVNDFVLTPFGYKKVLAFYEQGIKDTIRIDSSLGQLCCTKDHKIAVNTVLGPRYIQAKDLNSKGTFYMGKGIINDFELYYSNHKSNSINVPYAFQDLELCYYILGLCFADGSRQQNRMDIKLSIKDEQILLDLQNRLGNNTTLKTINSKSPTTDNICTSKTLSICSKYFNDLLDIVGYTNTKDFRDYKNIPDEYFNDFLRGYYDGDGSSNGYNLTFITHNKLKEHLLSDIKRLYGISESKTLFKNNVYYSWFTRADSVKLYKIMYDNSSIYLKRKKESALKEKKTFVEITNLDTGETLEFSSVSEASRYTGISTTSLCRVKANKIKQTHNVICKQITKITNKPYTRTFDNINIYDNGRQSVYDIQVEDTHNFIIKGGIISHNCIDALGTYLLGIKLKPFYEEAKMSGELDIQCLQPLTRFENELTLIDVDKLKNYSNYYENKIKEVQNRCWSTAGKEFNLGSNKETGAVLKSLNIHTGVTTKNGSMSTSKDSISKCLEKLSKDDPARQFLEDLTNYGTYVKQKSSYIDNIIEMAENNKFHKNRLRFSYKTTEVPSGRLAARWR